MKSMKALLVFIWVDPGLSDIDYKLAIRDLKNSGQMQ